MTEQFLYQIFECLSAVIQVLIIHQFIADFSEKRDNTPKLFWGYALFCTGLILLTVFFRQPIILLIYTGAGIYVLALTLHKMSNTIKLYLPFLFCIVVAVAELISMAIVTLLFAVNYESVLEFGTARAVGIVISKLFLIILLKFSRNIARSKTDNYSHAEILRSLPLYACPVMSIVLTHYIYTIDISKYDHFTIGPCLSLLAILYMNFIVFWYFDSIKSAFELRLWAEAAEARLEQQTQYYELLESHQKESIALRHDIKKHLLLVRSLVSDGYKEISEEYVSELEKQWEQDTPLVQTPHPVISALLTGEKIKAQEVGIDFRVCVNLISDIKINPADLCILIGNLLDNAIEACELLPSSADKYVVVKIAQRDSKLLIHIENPYISNTKKVKSSGKHGFGLQNVNSVILRCGGLISNEKVDGIYKVRVIIP